MYYATGPPPSVRPLNATVGIDSVYLQIKGVNKIDLDRFCRNFGLKYTDADKGKYQSQWKIFLAGGQTITVIFHFTSKTTTFQIGRLMDYSISGGDPHKLIQNLIQTFFDRRIQISGLDFAVDTKMVSAPYQGRLRKEVKLVKSTIYYNKPNNTTFTIYDKALKMGIYSIPLIRFELRLRQVLGRWRVNDFINNRQSLEKLARKIDNEINEGLHAYTYDTKTSFSFIPFNTVKVLEDFIEFLQGGNIPPIKDHHKVRQALEARDTFFSWMRAQRIADPKRINAYAKGKRAAVQAKIGVDPKTFKKAVKFYEGIPNFQISTWA